LVDFIENELPYLPIITHALPLITHLTFYDKETYTLVSANWGEEKGGNGPKVW
jgi:hypothetical protein